MNTFDSNNNRCDPATDFYRFGDSSNEEGFISQLTIIDEYNYNIDDDEDSMSICEAAPSLSNTCTSDFDESKSFDIKSNIEYDDELSLSSEDSDSASFDLISQMISNDEMSIESNTLSKKESTLQQYSSRNASAIAHEWHERIEKIYPNKTGEYAKSISLPIPKVILSPTLQPALRSNRVSKTKNRLRSIEVDYNDTNRTSCDSPIVQSTHIDSSIDLKESLLRNETRISRRQRKSNAAFRRKIVGTVGDIVTMNCIVCFVYLLFFLFQNVLARALEENNDLLNII